MKITNQTCGDDVPLENDPIKQMAGLCIAFETLAFSGQLFGAGDAVRNVLVTLGGFWPGLFGTGEGVFPGQAIFMFGTSVFIHGNPVHLLMNMVALFWLGPMVLDRIAAKGFWPLFGLSALGAGFLYTALTTSSAPMVGASGVVFGLLGTVSAWTVLDRWARRQSLSPLIPTAAGFIVLNVGLTILSAGTIAWEAHLGGFLGGVLAGVLTWRRPVWQRIVP